MLMQTWKEATRSEAALVGLRKILVPSDFSPAANAAFKYALRLQKKFPAQINVLHVLEPACVHRISTALSARWPI